MHKNSIRARVRMLRGEGFTYSEILGKLKLKLPKSTMSDWCQGVAMPAWYQAKVDEFNKTSFSKAQKMAHASLRLKRERLLILLEDRNKHLFGKLRDRDLSKMLLAMLYLGEGSKRPSFHGLSLGSSDPNIIRLYIKLLDFCYGIKSEILKCRVSYRADQDIKALEYYWSKVAGIPPNNFYKTIPDPRTVGKPTKNLDYKGVCVIITGHAEIQLELELISKIILKGL